MVIEQFDQMTGRLFIHIRKLELFQHNFQTSTKQSGSSRRRKDRATYELSTAFSSSYQWRVRRALYVRKCSVEVSVRVKCFALTMASLSITSYDSRIYIETHSLCLAVLFSSFLFSDLCLCCVFCCVFLPNKHTLTVSWTSSVRCASFEQIDRDCASDWFESDCSNVVLKMKASANP